MMRHHDCHSHDMQWLTATLLLLGVAMLFKRCIANALNASGKCCHACIPEVVAASAVAVV
jgi:hypothetical protein